MKIEELYKLYLKNDDNTLYFFNLKEGKMYFLNKRVLSLRTDQEITNDIPFVKPDDILLARRIANNKDSFCPFESMDESLIKKTIELFLKVCDRELKNTLVVTKSLDRQLYLIENSSQYELFQDILNDNVKEDVQRWVHMNEIEKVEYNRFQLPFTYLKKLLKLNPWQYFNNDSLIKIVVGEVNIFVNLKKEQKEINLYFGEPGFNDFELVKNSGIDNPSLIVLSLINRITCSFEDSSQLDEDERNLVINSKVDFDSLFPQITLFQENIMPTKSIKSDDLNILGECLKILYYGLIDYINNGKNKKLLKISLSKSDKITISSYVYKESKTINDYGFSYEEKDTECVLDYQKIYEAKIDVLYSDFDDGIEKYWIYALVVIDHETNEIVFDRLVSYDGKEKPLAIISRELNEFALENNFAHKVIVEDFLTEALLTDALGIDLEIEYGQISEILGAIIDEFDYLNKNEKSLKEKINISKLS